MNHDLAAHRFETEYLDLQAVISWPLQIRIFANGNFQDVVVL